MAVSSSFNKIRIGRQCAIVLTWRNRGAPATPAYASDRAGQGSLISRQSPAKRAEPERLDLDDLHARASKVEGIKAPGFDRRVGERAARRAANKIRAMPLRIGALRAVPRA